MVIIKFSQKIILTLYLVLFINNFSFAQIKNSMKFSIHQFKVKDLSGEIYDLSCLKGKKVMIVNTASKCGLTPQYEKLEMLYKKYNSKNFIIIGFPANNFLSQEPGSNDQIALFCEQNYGVSFPMMSKISVKGSDIEPLYNFLSKKNLNGVMNSSVKWNFQKYLINGDGNIEKVISPWTSPDDDEIIDWINS